MSNMKLSIPRLQNPRKMQQLMLRLCIIALPASPYYDGFLKCGTWEKRERYDIDVPKREHDIFLRPDTIDYKEDASDDEGDMSEMNTSLSLLCNSKQQQHYDNCIIKLPPYNTLL